MHTNPEKLHEIMELAVNISTNCDGGADTLDISLGEEDFLGLRSASDAHGDIHRPCSP